MRWLALAEGAALGGGVSLGVRSPLAIGPAFGGPVTITRSFAVFALARSKWCRVEAFDVRGFGVVPWCAVGCVATRPRYRFLVDVVDISQLRVPLLVTLVAHWRRGWHRRWREGETRVPIS